MAATLTRTLVGGPHDGHEHAWSRHQDLVIAHPCPDGGAYDVGLYDRDGVYRYSEHPGDRRYEPCGECSLCPGHLVEVGPSERYTWTAT